MENMLLSYCTAKLYQLDDTWYDELTFMRKNMKSACGTDVADIWF